MEVKDFFDCKAFFRLGPESHGVSPQGYKGFGAAIKINIDDVNPQIYDYFIQKVPDLVALDASSGPF
jgi:hypothetical protein